MVLPLSLFNQWQLSVQWNNNMKIFNLNKNKKSGFTIIEALIAVFILSISVASMLGVNALSSSSAKYANNEITANYLLQEAVDSIRNSRDTIAFQRKNEALGGWDNFLKRYGYSVSDGTKSKCFTDSGCILDINNFDSDGSSNDDVAGCLQDGCQALSFDSSLSSPLFYFYMDDDPNPSIFTRKVNMSIDPANLDEVKITATVTWVNSYGAKPRSQKLETVLLNWQY